MKNYSFVQVKCAKIALTCPQLLTLNDGSPDLHTLAWCKRVVAWFDSLQYLIRHFHRKESWINAIKKAWELIRANSGRIVSLKSLVRSFIRDLRGLPTIAVVREGLGYTSFVEPLSEVLKQSQKSRSAKWERRMRCRIISHTKQVMK